MKCPNCDNSLAAITYEGIRIETCPGCEGEWLDDNSLAKIETSNYTDNYLLSGYKLGFLLFIVRVL